MAIIGPAFAMIGRFAGRLLNSALGWATILLFGKVEGSKQTLLLVIALGSLLWVVTLVGVIFPDVGTLVLAFVPVPDFISDGIVRLIMLGLALLIPLAIGVAAVFIAEKQNRPSGKDLITAVLRGYPFTLVLAVTIIILAGASLIRKVRSLYKRWEDAHVPMVVKPGGYDHVLEDLEGVLDKAELDVTARPAPRILSVPPRLLEKVAGKALGGLVPDRLMLLAGGGLEVLVYPSDVAISGTKDAMARARAAIASQLTHSPAYLTTSAESERIEDEIQGIARDSQADIGVDAIRTRLQELDGKLARLTVPFDEWETVYRERLQVERDLLSRRLGEEPQPPGLADLKSLPPRGDAPSPVAERALAIGGLVLLAVDVLLLAFDRLRPRNRRRA
ncbi:MAG TPA: hypothetical protein VFR46_04835 [Actinomycetes bacterium]|nr:hypothetical protein [Actinomycetes bacterium]